MIQRDNSKYNMFLKIIILRSFLASNYQLYFLIIIRNQSVKLARDIEHTPIIKKTIEINFFFYKFKHQQQDRDGLHTVVYEGYICVWRTLLEKKFILRIK